MPSQGPNLPTVDSANSDWANPDNVKLTDGAYADSDLGGIGSTFSGQLTARGFGFSLPSGATVLGVAATCRVSASFDPSTVDFAPFGGFSLELHGVGILGSHNDSTQWTTTPQDITLGGPTDLWGYGGWSDTLVNDPDFGFQLRAHRGPSGSAHALVDSVTLTVYYSFGASAALTFDSTAVLTASGELSGSASIAFSASAPALSGISGTATLAFSASAVTPGILVGTAVLAFGSGSTVLTGSGALASNTPLAFSALLSPTGVAGMSSVSSLALSASGTLSASGALLGSSAMAFAAVESQAWASGSAAMTIQAAATLNGAAELSGLASLFILTAVAEPLAVGMLSGAAHLVIGIQQARLIEPRDQLCFELTVLGLSYNLTEVEC